MILSGPASLDTWGFYGLSKTFIGLSVCFLAVVHHDSLSFEARPSWNSACKISKHPGVSSSKQIFEFQPKISINWPKWCFYILASLSCRTTIFSLNLTNMNDLKPMYWTMDVGAQLMSNYASAVHPAQANPHVSSYNPRVSYYRVACGGRIYPPTHSPSA